MAKNAEKRYLYRNKITGVEFISSSICGGGAWEFVKEIISRTAAKQSEQYDKGSAMRKSKPEVKADDE